MPLLVMEILRQKRMFYNANNIITFTCMQLPLKKVVLFHEQLQKRFV